MKVNPVKIAAARLASRVLPRLSFATGLPNDAISRDPEEVAKYAKDALRVDTVTSRFVAASDLAVLLGAWGTCPNCRLISCPSDLDQDCAVNAADLALLLGAWGPC